MFNVARGHATGVCCYFLQPLAAYRGPSTCMIRGPITALQVGGKQFDTLYVIYRGQVKSWEFRFWFLQKAWVF